MIARGTSLRNAFNGETFTFAYPLDDAERAAIDVTLDAGGSGGGNALMHVHPKADETFDVTSGALEVIVNGVRTIIRPGQSITIPRGAPHCFKNANAGPTTFTAIFTPAQQHLRFFANFAQTVERHADWFGREGEPSLLMMALKLHAYRDHLYLAGPPVWAQKLIFAALAPIARWRGYRVLIPPLDGADR